MTIKLIKTAVAKVTGCNKQFRSPSSDVDLHLKPLILAAGTMHLHGFKEEDIRDTLGIEDDKRYDRIIKLYCQWVEDGASGQGNELTKRAFRQIVLIQNYLVLHNENYVPIEKYLKV